MVNAHLTTERNCVMEAQTMLIQCDTTLMFCKFRIFTFSHHIGSLYQQTNIFLYFQNKRHSNQWGNFPFLQHPSSGCFLTWPCWLKISQVWKGALVQGRIGWLRHSEWGLVLGRVKCSRFFNFFNFFAFKKVYCVQFSLIFYLYIGKNLTYSPYIHYWKCFTHSKLKELFGFPNQWYVTPPPTPPVVTLCGHLSDHTRWRQENGRTPPGNKPWTQESPIWSARGRS